MVEAGTIQGALFQGFGPVVNVASVPQRSPFRYAGGKTWLIPQVRQWLNGISFRPDEFIEPFAGGGSAGLTVGFENLADKVRLVELDPDVYSVWKCLFSGEAEQLADRVRNFRLNHTTVRAVIDSVPTNRVDRAFRTIVRNRVLHGGILAPGASVMREGENGKGLGSRWYPETLYRRMMAIGVQKKMFAVEKRDGIEIIKEHAERAKAVFFIDPPYTVAGSRLYTFHELDHAELFRACSLIKGDFLMTYDFAPEIVKLGAKYGFEMQTIPMKSRQHTLKQELLIGKSLRWLGTPAGPLIACESSPQTRLV